MNINNRVINILFLILLFPTLISAQIYKPKSNGEFIKHTYYSLSYSENNEQAEWVYYELSPKLVEGTISRTNNFSPDPKVSTRSAQLNDYNKSGFDRGHLCPAGSMKLNKTSMSESFYLSNMSPQLPSFNRGGWKRLEALVRNWAVQEGNIYVVSGPIFRDNKGSIGKNKVTIPGYYYKVIYAPKSKKMIGFIMPNNKITKSIQAYAQTVDKIESYTGIDFFPQLNDKLENSLEACVNIKNWNFSSSSSIYTSHKSHSVTTTSQCLGHTKTGARCRNKTTNSNGYCYIHKSQATDHVKQHIKYKSTSYSGRCIAITKAGTRCKRKASKGSKYCWQHQKR